MREKVITYQEDGQRLTAMGIPVSEGPRNYRLMITWPISDEGRIIEIPLAQIESIKTAERRPRGEKHTIVDGP